MDIAWTVLEFVLRPLCDVVMRDDELCKTLLDGALPFWFDKAFDFLNPDVVCFKYKLCRKPKIIKDLNKNYINRVLKDRPPRKEVPKPNPSLKPLRFVSFADAHVDYFYKEVPGYLSNCRELLLNAERQCAAEKNQDWPRMYQKLLGCSVLRVPVICL